MLTKLFQFRAICCKISNLRKTNTDLNGHFCTDFYSYCAELIGNMYDNNLI